jgi:hypothetical protein
MPKLKTLLKYIFFSISFINFSSVFSQNAFINYNFNSGTSYSTLSPIIAANVTCSVSSTETWQTYNGISSGQNAFDRNDIAGNSIAMVNSSGTNSRYFQFALGGSLLPSYSSYQLYLQSQRSSTGATTITLAYSIDGINYTNFSTTQLTGLKAYYEDIFDLSSITPINGQSNVYFRLLVSGASGTGTVRIDNFQIKAIKNLASIISTSVTNYTDETSKGQISINLNGITAPYQIAWNGGKLPVNHNYYVDYITNFPNAQIDTIQLYAKLDSLKQYTILKDLQSGIYNNKIYDTNKDSASFTTLVGNNFSWITSGITTSTNVISALTNTNFRVFYGVGNTITQSVPNSTNNFVVSDCAINASEAPAYFEFKINNSSDVTDVGLKTASSINTNLVDDMIGNTYIHFTGNQTSPSLMQIYFNGTLVNSSTYATNDVIGILLDPNTQNVSYYKNSIVSYSNSTIQSSILSNDLQLKVAMRTSGSILSSIIMVGPRIPIKNINVIITDVNCSNSASGIINFSAYSFIISDLLCDYTVTGPNGYTNSGTLLASNYLYGLVAGTYVITIPIYNSACGTTPVSFIVRSFEVANMPDWVNQAPVGYTNVDPIYHSFNITSLQTSPYTWLGGASTTNVLLQSDAGWAEFKPKLLGGTPTTYFKTTCVMFGFNYIDLSTTPADNDHFFFVKNYVAMLSSGIGIGSSYLYGPYLASMSAFGSPIGVPFYTSSADVLRVNKLSPTPTTMNFQFYKNNVLLSSTIGSHSSSDLVADVSVNQKDQIINRPRLSFGCKLLEQYAVLNKKINGGYYTCPNKKLLFKYNEEYDDKDGLLTYNIYDKYNKIIINNISNPLNVIYGDNRYSIDISLSSILLSGVTMPYDEYYILEVINEKNEKWYLRFKK